MNDQELNNETFSGSSSRQETPGVSNAPPRYVTYIPYGYTPKTYEEKKGVRKCALVIGISLLLLTGITYFWGVGYLFIMRALGFTMLRAQELVDDPAVMQVLQILLSTLMFTVPFIRSVPLRILLIPFARSCSEA